MLRRLLRFPWLVAKLLVALPILTLFVIFVFLPAIFAPAMEETAITNLYGHLQQGNFEKCDNSSGISYNITGPAISQLAEKLGVSTCEEALKVARQKLVGFNLDGLKMENIGEFDYMDMPMHPMTRYKLSDNPLGIKTLGGGFDKITQKTNFVEIR